jgi:uncharacterized protein YciI
MTTYFVVARRSGPEWDASKALEQQSGWIEHAAYMDRLVDDGIVVLGGPLDDEHRVILVVEASSEDGARGVLDADPWSQTHLVVDSVERWTIRLDGRRGGSRADAAEIVETYVRAWHERDETVRRRLLEESWAAGGVYTDPGETIEGRDALFDAISDFQVQRPGVRIAVRSRIDAFGRHFRFDWATVDDAGTVLREGVDVGQLDADGRIVSIVAFFGLAPGGPERIRD